MVLCLLDLDEVKRSKQGISIPEKINPPEDVSDFIKNHGTVVHWIKYDNQGISASCRCKAPMAYILEGTYRRFIWGTAKGYEAVLFCKRKRSKCYEPSLCK